MEFIDVVDNDSSAKFNRLMKRKPTFALFFMPGCGHCESLEPEWEGMIDKLKQHYEGDLLLARIRNDMMEDVNCDKKIAGFPTMFVLENGKKKKEYMGKRKMKDLLKFLEDNFSVQRQVQRGGKRRRRRRKRRRTRYRKTKKRYCRRRKTFRKRRR